MKATEMESGPRPKDAGTGADPTTGKGIGTGIGTGKRAGTGAMIAWSTYDWANSAYPTVIATFVFSAYFTKAIAPDQITGTAWWGYAMSLSALAIAIGGPILGSVADRAGRRKPWLAFFTILCVLSTAPLWYATPTGGLGVLLVLALVGLSNFAFETGMVFYNAMLPDLVEKERMGRWSGWGWGIGYFGGLCCLGLCLVAFVQADTPWFGVGKEESANIRAVAPLVAVWFALFSLPLFLFTPDTKGTGLTLGEAVSQGMKTLVNTFRNLGGHGQVFRFLIARMIYIDGVNTIFVFGGIYAVGTFGMDFQELIIFGIGMNVTAGLGAFGFAWVDDWIGPRKTILISLLGLIIMGIGAVVVEDKYMFMGIALTLSIFVGPVQAASRSFMGRLAPPHMLNEMFGLYALSGKATAFLGPALLGWVTAEFGSQRAGMATILVFFVIGGILVWPVRGPTDR